jgi:mono/diheme cytochrome c family protein
MSDKKFFALSALFDNADSIMKAASTVADKGYKNWDVNTPFPVHGMDPAMKLKPSKIGYFTIIVGLTFMSLMLSFIYWTNNVDYPQIIGGKPFFAFPTYVPIMFEITILTGAVLSVKMMIAVIFKFPNNAHPIHDSEYAKRTSSDLFGIYIEEKDGDFDYDQIEAMYKELGAVSIQPIYYDQVELEHKNNAWDPKFVIGLVAIAGFVSFSVYMHMNKLLYIAPFDWMMVQPRVDYGEAGTSTIWNGDKKYALAKPVEGTVARGFIPYAYHIDSVDQASNELVNYTMPSAENLELGKKKFETYCSPCHGNQARGDGRLIGDGELFLGRSLLTEYYQGFSDGRIYHTITKGKGLMPGYEAQITRDERWSIVNYLRVLQSAVGETPKEETEQEMAQNSEVE